MDEFFDNERIPVKTEELQPQNLYLPKRSELKEIKDLMRIFNIIHNHIYANEGLSPNETFNEILKILFLKIYDESYEKGTFVTFGLTDDDYFQIMEGKSTKFKSNMDSLFEKAKEKFQDVFSKSEQIALKESTLAFVVGQLQFFHLSKSKRDIKGTAFQKFIYSQQRGSRGQFLTPEPIMNLTVGILKPQPSDKILDPSCGSGGFLVSAMNFVTEQNFSKLSKTSKLNKRQKFSSNLCGVEINPTMIKVAKLRMLFENDGNAEILKSDGLMDWSELKQVSIEQHLKNSFQQNSFDMILTNPPFGTQGKITIKSILKRFDLGFTWNTIEKNSKKTSKLQNSQVPDILFIERCISLLKNNGKLGIVLPVGDLENKTLSYVRNYILSKAKIIAVISLPSDTFIPFGTGVKACVLFIQKLDEVELKKAIKDDYKIFFSIIKKIGYEGNKNGTVTYKKNNEGKTILDKNKNPIVDEEISDVIDAFNKFEKNSLKKESDLSFVCSFSELEDRLTPEYYRLTFRDLFKKLKKLNAVPLHSVAKIINARSPKLKESQKPVKYVEISNINPSLSELSTFSQMKTFELPSRASYDLSEGDIVTSVSGISIGTQRHASAYVSKSFDGCICTNGLRVIRNSKIDPFYLLAYFRSDFFLLQILRYRTGAAIPAIDNDDFKNLQIILPDQKTTNKISKEIQLSQEYRNKSKQILDDTRSSLNKLF